MDWKWEFSENFLGPLEPLLDPIFDNFDYKEMVKVDELDSTQKELKADCLKVMKHKAPKCIQSANLMN